MCCDILGRRIQHEKYDTHAREESMNEPQTIATILENRHHKNQEGKPYETM